MVDLCDCVPILMDGARFLQDTLPTRPEGDLPPEEGQWHIVKLPAYQEDVEHPVCVWHMVLELLNYS